MKLRFEPAKFGMFGEQQWWVIDLKDNSVFRLWHTDLIRNELAKLWG